MSARVDFRVNLTGLEADRLRLLAVVNRLRDMQRRGEASVPVVRAAVAAIGRSIDGAAGLITRA